MYEVELKVRAAHDRVRDRLESAGARAVGSVRQEDTYYDAPHRDFARTDEALRIRSETTPDTERPLVTYKGPLVDDSSKTREEAETTLGDAAAMAEILGGLGFEPAATVRKERERFELDDYTVTLDTVEGLGEFVEVETEVDSESEVETARRGAVAVLDRLGLDHEDGIRTSYLGLLLSEEDAQQ